MGFAVYQNDENCLILQRFHSLHLFSRLLVACKQSKA